MAGLEQDVQGEGLPYNGPGKGLGPFVCPCLTDDLVSFYRSLLLSLFYPQGHISYSL